MSKFKNKIAVITGGSTGIGLATAHRFIKDGAQVVITGRNQDALDIAVAKLGDRAIGIRGDVANLDDLDRLFAQVQKKFGRVDVLFANAGIAPFIPFDAVTGEDFDYLFNINVRGLFFTVQKALPLLAEDASVILNASVVAQSGFPPANDGLISFAGGIPIVNKDGVTIGAIGVSGSSLANDLEVAEAGATAFTSDRSEDLLDDKEFISQQ